MVRIVATERGLSSQWLTGALRAAGVLDRQRVISVESRPVGNGLIGTSLQLRLRYDAPAPDAPASVVVKLAATDRTSRATGAALNLYGREVAFYQTVAATVAMRTPNVYFAGIDGRTQAFTLVFEDLGPARAGDQLTGCSLDDAATALDEAAALHGSSWDRADLLALDWLNTRGRGRMKLEPLVVAFRERFGAVVEPEILALADRLPTLAPLMQADRTAPWCVLHGDFRLDNVLFDIKGGREAFATLDWQTVSLGPGLLDVAYFLGTGLQPEDRRAEEENLLRRYHAALLGRGVAGYSFAECWRDYRRFAIHGIQMAVISATIVQRTPRADAMFLAMLRRAATQVQELGSFACWE